MRGRETWRERARRIKPLVALVRAARILADPLLREAWLTERRTPARMMQPYPTTYEDRHPRLFAFVRDQLEGIERPRILSYGCSTGEEAFSLARVLAKADITAVDINKAAIAKAKRRLEQSHAKGRTEQSDNCAIKFAVAASPEDVEGAMFDAVFCLSVLRHGRLRAEQPDRCSAIMPFSKFEATAMALDALVKPGGLLVLWRCSFRLSDTPIAGKYTPILSVGREKREPVYGPDDRRLPHQPSEDCVFRKM